MSTYPRTQSEQRQADQACDLDQQSKLARHELISAGRWIDARGWCPATGGNFSIRLPERPLEDRSILGETSVSRCVVTASGRHKGELTEADFLEVDLEGEPIDQDLSLRPSAETLVHVMLYKLSDEIGAVLHTHSIPNTVLSMIESSDQLSIKGFEMQKALSGHHDHDTAINIEIFDNTQDMRQLAQEIKERWILRDGLKWALLIRGHGIYVWGREIHETRRHLEGLEFLLSCVLELKKIS